jgi:uncharacterized protein (DUF2336 family)
MSKRSPSDDLLALARSLPQDRDATLLRATTALFCQEPIHERDAVRRYEELALHFLSRAGAPDRLYVATLLAGRADAPASIMRLLARDQIDVATPVLRQSSVLSTIDLLGVIAVTGPEHHKLIESRPSLNADVIRALALARPKVSEAHVTASAATTAPAVTTEQQVSTIDPAIGGFLDLPSAGRLQVLGRIAARGPVARGTSLPRRIEQALRHAFANSEIVAAAKKRDRDRLIGALSESLDIVPDTVRRLMDDPSGEPLVLMLKATGLKDAEGRTVLLLANPAIGESVERFFHLADLHASLEIGVAESFVAAWRSSSGVSIAPRHQPVLVESAGVRNAAAAAAVPQRSESYRVSRARRSASAAPVTFARTFWNSRSVGLSS